GDRLIKRRASRTDNRERRGNRAVNERNLRSAAGVKANGSTQGRGSEVMIRREKMRHTFWRFHAPTPAPPPKAGGGKIGGETRRSALPQLLGKGQGWGRVTGLCTLRKPRVDANWASPLAILPSPLRSGRSRRGESRSVAACVGSLLLLALSLGPRSLL